MSRTNRIAAAAALVGLLGMSSLTASAAAQATASISAIANVSGVAALTATGTNDLNFGTVTAGVPTAPASLATDAGRFHITGQASTAVTITFTLPTVLTGPAAATIPITFGSADGLEWNPYPGAFSTFDPNSAHFTSLDGAGALDIGISGLVSPPALTVSGSYTGTISMTVTY